MKRMINVFIGIVAMFLMLLTYLEGVTSRIAVSVIVLLCATLAVDFYRPSGRTNDNGS